MTSLNRLELIGTLANNPELRYTPSGRPVASFTLDVETEQLLDLRIPGPVINSFPVTAWGKLGELCNRFLREGSWIYVQGGVVTEKTLITTTIHDEEFGDYDEEDIKYFARLVARKIEFFKKSSANDAEAFLAKLHNRGASQDSIALPLTRPEARVVWYGIINGLGEITVLDQESKSQLKSIEDALVGELDSIESLGNVVIHVTESELTDINSFLHILQSDSECGYMYGAVGADRFLGSTGVRLSELAKCVPTMLELIQTTDGLLEDWPKVGQPAVGANQHSQDPIRVLVVDDVADTRANIRRLFSSEADITVIGEASDGQDAIKQFDALLPDVMTMCINMPNMDGIAATEAIRRTHPSAKVIILSVQEDNAYVRRAIMAGACDYLTKPPMADELLSAIRLAAGRCSDSQVIRN